MRKIILIGFAALALACLCVSCATIVSGSTQDVTFVSDPEGATVRVDGLPVGRTPLTVSLDTGKSHTVELSKEGYETQYATLSRSVSGGWIVADIFLTGCIGIVVDLVTGSIYKLKPDNVYVQL